jgi:hypothetical protein
MLLQRNRGSYFLRAPYCSLRSFETVCTSFSQVVQVRGGNDADRRVALAAGACHERRGVQAKSGLGGVIVSEVAMPGN